MSAGPKASSSSPSSASPSDVARVQALIRRALDNGPTGATEEERRTSAVIALQTADRLGLTLADQTGNEETAKRLKRLELELGAAARAVRGWRARALAAEKERDELAGEVESLLELEETERGPKTDQVHESLEDVLNDLESRDDDGLDGFGPFRGYWPGKGT